MPNQQLIDYIKDCKNQGFSQEKIKEALLSAGWSDENINEAFDYFLVPKEQKNETEKKEKRKKISKLSLLSIIVIVIFVIFGLALAYQFYFAKPSFAKVMTQSMNTLEELNSFSYSLNFDIDVTTSQDTLSFIGLDQDAYFLINIDGETDLINSNSAWLLNLDTNTLGEELSLSLEAKNINEDIYLKINSLPEILTMFIPNTIEENWFKLTSDDLLGDRLPKEERKETMIEVNKILKEESENILDIFIINEEKVVTIDSQEMYYYNLTIDLKEFIDLVVKVNNKLHEKDANLVYFKLNQEDADTMFTEFNDNIDLENIELWINKDNYFPYKISSKLISEEFIVSYDATFANFNQVTSISEPEGALTFEELMELIGDPFDMEDYEEGYMMSNEFDDMDFSMPLPDELGYLEDMDNSVLSVEETFTPKQSPSLINYSGNNINLEFESQDISRIELIDWKGDLEVEFFSEDFEFITQSIENSKKTESNLVAQMHTLNIFLKDGRYIDLDYDAPIFLLIDKTRFQYRRHLLFESQELSDFIETRLKDNMY